MLFVVVFMDLGFLRAHSWGDPFVRYPTTPNVTCITSFNCQFVVRIGQLAFGDSSVLCFVFFGDLLRISCQILRVCCLEDLKGAG